MKVIGINDVLGFDFLEAPLPEAVLFALKQLHQLSVGCHISARESRSEDNRVVAMKQNITRLQLPNLRHLLRR